MSEAKSQISGSLPDELITQLDGLCGLSRQDRDWIIQQALQHHLSSEGRALREDAEGLSDLDEGRHSDLEDVLKKASAIIDHAEVRKARRAG